MKKQLIIVGILVILLTVDLSGCNKQNGDGISIIPSSNYIEISDVNVTRVCYRYYLTEQIGEHEGFYHDYPRIL